jgi:hypothetical protein
MTEPKPILVSFRYSDFPRRSLGTPFSPRVQPWAWLASALYWIMVFATVILMLSLVPSAGKPTYQNAALFGPGVAVGMAFGILTINLMILHEKKVKALAFDAIARAPCRSDGVEVLLDASGIRTAGTGTLSHMTWQTIVSVEELDDFTLLRPSAVEYLPIPHASLPPGVTPEVLRRAIAHWRSA